ncbi:hypothetical protein ACSS6W_006395 [Trichoderma asperelloides]|uniref:Uncharacterized protein n=1 Tax=Trichoderma asperellum TaxID=101201 RepID=A0A6V8QUV5_TRIAP|nr:hypothetical protein TASIC1_0006033900 [Trichoderma asperellum]
MAASARQERFETAPIPVKRSRANPGNENLGIQMPGSQAPPSLRWNLILVSLVNMVRRSPYDAILILDKVKHALLSGGIGQCRGIIMYKYWVLRSSVAKIRMYR